MRRYLHVALLMLVALPVWGAIGFSQAKSTANANTANCSVVATSNFTTGNVLVVAVAIRTITSTVSTVTAGTDSLVFYNRKSNVNVRVEVWVDASYNGGTSKTVTVTLSASSKCVGSVAEYSGVSSVGHRFGLTSSAANPSVSVVIQDSNNWNVMGFAGQSTGTFTASTGNLRSSAVTSGAGATSNVGGAICDNTAASGTVTCAVTNSDVLWANEGVELRTTTNVGFSQSESSGLNADACSPTCTIPLILPVFAGSTILQCARWDSGSATLSVTDSSSNSYASAFGPLSFAAGLRQMQCFYAKNVSATTTLTATYTFSSNVNSANLAIELVGGHSTSPLDLTSTATGLTGSSQDSGSVSITYDKETLIGFANASNGMTWTPGATYTCGDFPDSTVNTQSSGWCATNALRMFEIKNVTSCASYSADTTSSSSVIAWGIALMTWRGANASACVASSCSQSIALLGVGCR